MCVDGFVALDTEYFLAVLWSVRLQTKTLSKKDFLYNLTHTATVVFFVVLTAVKYVFEIVIRIYD